MKTSSFREKDKYILNLIVESYLKTGKPISSGFIAQRSRYSVCSATVRNIMKKLEEHGYLFQPHSSAGRIPTDKGFRFYVNSLLDDAVLPEKQFNLPLENFSFKKGDFNSLLIQVSKILAEYSDNLGFALSPRVSKIHFHHIHFIKISEVKAMIILITSNNLVLTEIFETHRYFTQSELDKASQYINQSFKGKNLLFVRNYFLRELPKYKTRYENILSKLISLLRSHISQEEQESQVFLQGTSRLLGKPELFDRERLQYLFQSFDEPAGFAKLLSDFISLAKVKVLIGSELNIPNISDCSLVLSHYGYHSQVLGSLGIIGPKRIPYKKIIPLVDCIAKRLSQTISFHQ